MIITIDGRIATGKSTIAKQLARSIGFIFFDTGAMYRSITYGIHKNNIDLDDKEALDKYLFSFNFNIKFHQGEKEYLVEGEDVTDIIRGELVTSLVSKVSANRQVRDKMVSIQRKYAEGVNAVFEGRDMGTVVFPDADLKIFLTGDSLVRAKRRYEELKAKYPEEYKDLTIEKTLEDINRRDEMDSTREISPLKQAADAFVIDTSNLSMQEVVLKIQEYKDMVRLRLKTQQVEKDN